MKNLSKIIPITTTAIGFIVPFTFFSAPSIIAILAGGALGLLSGSVIVNAVDLLFEDNKDIDYTKKKRKRKPKKHKFNHKKRNAMLLGKKKTSTRSRYRDYPVSNILTLDDEDELTNRKTVSNTEEESVSNILTLDEEELTNQETASNLNEEPVSNILTLEENDEVVNQDRTYSLKPLSTRKQVVFDDKYTRIPEKGQNSLRVNEEKIIQDVSLHLEQLQKILVETQRQMEELQKVIDELMVNQKSTLPKVKRIS